MNKPILAILIVSLGLSPGVWAQDEPADANATADVTANEQPTEGQADPAPDESQADAAEQPVPDTVQQMQIIEALPIAVPEEQQAEPIIPTAPASMDVKSALRNRMNDLLAEPMPNTRGDAVRGQLVELTNNASQLALLSDPGPDQFEALSVQMQALYAQITETIDPGQVDRLLSRLRSAARRTKAIDLPQAPAVGDFWLMTAELFDLNRTPLSVKAQREQAAALMAEYLEDHPEAGPSESVRTAYIELQKARGIDLADDPLVRELKFEEAESVEDVPESDEGEAADAEH